MALAERGKVCLRKLLCVFGSLRLAIELHSPLLLNLLLNLLLVLLVLPLRLLRWSFPLVEFFSQRPNMPLDQVAHLEERRCSVWIYILEFRISDLFVRRNLSKMKNHLEVIRIWSPWTFDRLRNLDERSLRLFMSG